VSKKGKNPKKTGLNPKAGISLIKVARKFIRSKSYIFKSLKSVNIKSRKNWGKPFYTEEQTNIEKIQCGKKCKYYV